MGDNKTFHVKGSEIVQLAAGESDIPEINGQANIDYSGCLIYQEQKTGATIRSGRIGADGYLAPHRATGTAYVRIIGGSGVIGISEDDGSRICEISVGVDDEVIFEAPMKLHYYKAGKDGLRYRVVGF